ncbi:MaoC family dehydratase [Proteiniborus sp.]|uniref:MaoC family dehydratase n=1 Tax=Proteiniborus sp. TaxID=2079015 RepID=UPI00331D6D44
MNKGKTYDEINIGDKACVQKTISESDVYIFAGIVGDLNSMHINEEAAKNSIFGNRICHGMLIGSFISPVLGMQLPGPGTIYLSQNLKFVAPVKIGDTITAEVEVIEKLVKNKIRLKTNITNQENKTVIYGEAVVLPPK